MRINVSAILLPHQSHSCHIHHRKFLLSGSAEAAYEYRRAAQGSRCTVGTRSSDRKSKRGVNSHCASNSVAYSVWGYILQMPNLKNFF